MSNVAVVFWSGTGNTEAMADLIAQGASAKGAKVSIIQASDFGADKLDGYDAIAFGCPAMGDEELEDTEFLPMYDEVEPLLGDRKVVLFGSYDWNDGEWMELWEQRAESAGVNVVDSPIAKKTIPMTKRPPSACASEPCSFRASGKRRKTQRAPQRQLDRTTKRPRIDTDAGPFARNGRNGPATSQNGACRE